MKHTGYGNAAGLLMSHGLLGGGKSQSQGEYSSDSESSDTEEYQKNKERFAELNVTSCHWANSPKICYFLPKGIVHKNYTPTPDPVIAQKSKEW